MPVIKIRFSSIVKKVNLDLQLPRLMQYIEEAFSLPPSCYRISCTKPISITVQTQADLDSLSVYPSLEFELLNSEESLYAQIIRELLEIPSNKSIVTSRFVEIIRQFPSTGLDALIPVGLEISIKEKLSVIYREAASKAERKSPFKLVYVTEGGKQVLRGLPSSQWINYSTTNIEDLSKSLPPNVIQRLNANK